MKIAFIGCVQSSYLMLEKLLSLPDAEVVGVVTLKESSFNSDFKSLEPLALKLGIPCLLADREDLENMTAWLRKIPCDVIYCFGWSRLLPRAVLDLPKQGVVGYHPAALPQNRGRHPIIWALALGLEQTASTFFFMDEGADAGPLLSQVPVTIDRKDDAGSLYAKLMNVALKQVAEFTPQLAYGRADCLPQDASKATTWRKRSKADGQIDWRMSAQSIYNLIRALAKPYPGAHCMYEGREVKIWKAEWLKSDRLNDEPGKVLISSKDIVIKCGEGSLRLLEHEFGELPKQGSYL